MYQVYATLLQRALHPPVRGWIRATLSCTLTFPDVEPAHRQLVGSVAQFLALESASDSTSAAPLARPSRDTYIAHRNGASVVGIRVSFNSTSGRPINTKNMSGWPCGVNMEQRC